MLNLGRSRNLSVEREPELMVNHQINDPNFDRKLDPITAGTLPFIKDHLY